MPRKNQSELFLEKSSSKERAARLRCLRAMTSKPREYFQKIMASHVGPFKIGNPIEMAALLRKVLKLS